MSHFKYFLLTLSIINSLCRYGKLQHLKILDLSYNSFTRSIPPYIGALSSLKAISLSSNPLYGILPIRGKNLL